MAGEAPGKKMDRTSTWSDADKIRTIVARLVWLVFVICALALAVAALLYAIEAESTNNLVSFFYNLADTVDLNFFGLHDPIREFRTDGRVDEQKTALFNYGIGSILYLIVGRIVEKLIHP
ncbi:MAG: hypothetical protein M3237_11190 [Actinomycetota bacterium]|nr:hypothetical protein [Actinomycetota bacterium]